jgi:hypothetical protein
MWLLAWFELFIKTKPENLNILKDLAVRKNSP